MMAVRPGRLVAQATILRVRNGSRLCENGWSRGCRAAVVCLRCRSWKSACLSCRGRSTARGCGLLALRTVEPRLEAAFSHPGLRLDRCDQRSGPHDVDDAGKIVGEHVQRHFGGDAWQRLRQEVGCSDPRLDCPERMLDRLAPLVSGSPTGSKSPPTRRPLNPKPPPPDPSGRHQNSAIALRRVHRANRRRRRAARVDKPLRTMPRCHPRLDKGRQTAAQVVKRTLHALQRFSLGVHDATSPNRSRAGGIYSRAARSSSCVQSWGSVVDQCFGGRAIFCEAIS
jgi:hypothetical protein